MAKYLEIKHEVEISFRIVCNHCNGSPEVDQDGDTLVITPCEACLDASYEQGIKEGREL